jgi:flagellar motor protein MotB
MRTKTKTDFKISEPHCSASQQADCSNKTLELKKMEEKIAKLQEATDLAKDELQICKEALQKATKDLEDAKDKYRSLPQSEKEALQVNATELPELIETEIRAKNVFETVEARYATNLRYLHAFKKKAGSS